MVRSKGWASVGMLGSLPVPYSGIFARRPRDDQTSMGAMSVARRAAGNTELLQTPAKRPRVEHHCRTCGETWIDSQIVSACEFCFGEEPEER